MHIDKKGKTQTTVFDRPLTNNKQEKLSRPDKTIAKLTYENEVLKALLFLARINKADNFKKRYEQ